ncbi:TetR/AcrR family transcriptional regulator C-terminal domain-containing protein [Actinoplanes sp. TBRC 11911]|uniref:TetR/AcrR family transcriptional regulator C-terminal domain-containing protein n=1 Tax=Actinoplanes sp. TBRC 11911 TaxID=2729386 RepID=UPI0028A11327|nr:TetR/AcrR family transcriptional regulator C-terminal domain-containing protein [Actinoplanes sp. TBRC 11911]
MAAKRTRGVRAGLTRDQVLDAALALADREGLAGLTMRRLGAELGVEAMTLYHYVPNKTALVDGLVERIFTTAYSIGGTWREALSSYAERLRSTLLEHPAVLPVIVRPVVTQATLDAVEEMLRLLVDAGFPLGRALDSLNALTLFVIGHTSAEVAIGPDSSPEVDPDRHPLMVAAVRSGAGADDYDRFRYAVAAMLTGFDELSTGGDGRRDGTRPLH